MACSRLSWWRQEDQKVKVNFDHTVSLKPNWDGGSEKQANHSEDLEQTNVQESAKEARRGREGVIP